MAFEDYSKMMKKYFSISDLTLKKFYEMDYEELKKEFKIRTTMYKNSKNCVQNYLYIPEIKKTLDYRKSECDVFDVFNI